MEAKLSVFEDLIIELDPPPNRSGKCKGAKEQHLTEAAAMLAYCGSWLRPRSR
jgi:hypothetical protein